MRESGYDPVIVFDWLETHCTRRDDGRYLTIVGQLLDDSHRDTFDRWYGFVAADETYRVPLGRLDEILLTYGVMLHELEDWATTLYGWDGFMASADGETA